MKVVTGDYDNYDSLVNAFKGVHREDQAEAAANILTSDGHDDKKYFLSNTENISFDDVAGMVSSITGKRVNYISPSPEHYIDRLRKAGKARFRKGIFHTGVWFV